MAASPARVKLLAGAGMVAISTTMGVLYKVSQAATGGFHYSTTSAITLAEFAKLLMSWSFHAIDIRRSNPDKGWSEVWVSIRDQLSLGAIGHIWLLSFLYASNNQLSFYAYTMADPGTIFLFKSASTLIVAAIQCSFAGKGFSGEQWRAMGLQACGMLIVQYDPCQSRPLYSLTAYACMAISTAITAVSAARNEYLVKNYKIGLNVQNMVLYAGGVWMNLFAFVFLPNPNSKQADLGFFEGYDNPLAISVVLANAVIGLVITAVYKYADAIVKCIAADVTSVLLCIISVMFFGLQSSLIRWCGVSVVCFAVHMYTVASSPAHSAAPPAAASSPAGQGQPDKGGKGGEERTPSNQSLVLYLVGTGSVLLLAFVAVQMSSNLTGFSLVEGQFGGREATTVACITALAQKAEVDNSATGSLPLQQVWSCLKGAAPSPGQA